MKKSYCAGLEDSGTRQAESANHHQQFQIPRRYFLTVTAVFGLSRLLKTDAKGVGIVRPGQLLDLTADHARTFAAILLRDEEELDRRQEAGNAD